MAESSNDDALENILIDAEAVTGNFVRRQYSNADFNVPKRFVLSGIYELPFGRGKQFGSGWSSVRDTLIGGWTLNYIFELQDGYPFTVTLPRCDSPTASATATCLRASVHLPVGSTAAASRLSASNCDGAKWPADPGRAKRQCCQPVVHRVASAWL